MLFEEMVVLVKGMALTMMSNKNQKEIIAIKFCSIFGMKFNDEKTGLKYSHDAVGIVGMANKGKNTNSSQVSFWNGIILYHVHSDTSFFLLLSLLSLLLLLLLLLLFLIVLYYICKNASTGWEACGDWASH